jgi:hypothetical protein
MMSLRLAPPRPNHLLWGASVLLAGLAIWPWLVPPAPSVRALVVPQASAPPPQLPALPAITKYAAIVERPLFAPSRRAPAGAAPAALGSAIEGRYRLVGILGTGPTRKAFVADGARRAEIAEGGMLGGWTVTQIGQDRVMLRSAAGEAVLKLNRTASEPAKP